MANTFKNQGAEILDSPGGIVYTAPAATQSIIHSCYISNIDGTSSADVSIQARATSVDTYYYVAKTVPVPADSTLVLDKPIDLEATGDVKMTASTTGDLEVVMGILEIT